MSRQKHILISFPKISTCDNKTMFTVYKEVQLKAGKAR